VQAAAAMSTIGRMSRARSPVSPAFSFVT
jgi:hypothetical protein